MELKDYATAGTAIGGTVPYQYTPPTQAICPNCGYCPHCRRGNYYSQPYWQWVPQYAPTYTICGSNGGL